MLGCQSAFRRHVKVAGHPVRSAVRLRVELEWEIATWICPYHQDLWQKRRPIAKFKQTEVWDCLSNFF